jgi:hypothetical protein
MDGPCGSLSLSLSTRDEGSRRLGAFLGGAEVEGNKEVTVEDDGSTTHTTTNVAPFSFRTGKLTEAVDGIFRHHRLGCL